MSVTAAPAAAPIYARHPVYLRTFASQLADKLGVNAGDVAGAIVDLALAGLVELSVSPQGIILRANPLQEETDAQETGPRLPR